MAATEADASTQGKAAGEVERLRTEFRLMEAAQQDVVKNGGSLDDYADRIQKLADRASEAAQNLARAKVASEIKFDRATIGLSDEDVRIAQRLRGVYGDDIPAALASSEAAAMRFNNVLRDAKQEAINFADSFVQGLLQGRSASEALSSSLKSLASSQASAALKSTDVESMAIHGVVGAGSWLHVKETCSRSEPVIPPIGGITAKHASHSKASDDERNKLSEAA